MSRQTTLFLFLALTLSGCGSGLWGYTPVPGTPGDPPQTSLLVTPTLFPTFTPAPPGSTPAPLPSLELPTAAPTAAGTSPPPVLYYSQAGDSLDSVAARFGVQLEEITSDTFLTPGSLLPLDTLLVIPRRFSETSPSERIMPDSEIIYGPSAAGFSASGYVQQANGKLATFEQYLGSTGWTSGSEAVERISIENSINPRLVLAIIDYESGWVRGQPTNIAEEDYPLGYLNFYYKGLFRQLMWTSEVLQIGYYGWRSGSLTEVSFPDGRTVRLSPEINAGTAALQYFFAQTHSYEEWQQILDPNVGFPKFYLEMFGDPWARAQAVEPTLPPTLTQPALSLPFARGKTWSYSGGPHAAWEMRGALAALDFAPPSTNGGCEKSEDWVLAMATGVVVRSEFGVVVVDLDGDGLEQTGWNILYLHIAADGRPPVGAWLEHDERIGHPSCEGGRSTGTHVHVARKYNGEWVLAEGPIPFNLDGWIAHNGEAPYKGTLTQGELVVTACACGSYETRITRPASD